MRNGMSKWGSVSAFSRAIQIAMLAHSLCLIRAWTLPSRNHGNSEISECYKLPSKSCQCCCYLRQYFQCFWEVVERAASCLLLFCFFVPLPARPASPHFHPLVPRSFIFTTFPTGNAVPFFLGWNANVYHALHHFNWHFGRSLPPVLWSWPKIRLSLWWWMIFYLFLIPCSLLLLHYNGPDYIQIKSQHSFSITQICQLKKILDAA